MQGFHKAYLITHHDEFPEYPKLKTIFETGAMNFHKLSLHNFRKCYISVCQLSSVMCQSGEVSGIIVHKYTPDTIKHTLAAAVNETNNCTANNGPMDNVRLLKT